MEMNGFFFSAATLAMARLVPELVPPISMSRPWVSNHSRALVAATSGLFWWSAEMHLDLLAVDGAAHVGDGHADGFHAALAVDVGVHAGHVGDDADADDVARDLGVAGAAAPNSAGGRRGRRRRTAS